MSPEPGLSKGRELTGLKQKVSALENQLTHVREQIEKLRSAAPTRKAQAYERGHEVMCNPAGQAGLLNQAGTELNVVCGICVGHDAIFGMVSEAPVTTLIVKDRVLAHNTIGAICSPYIRNKMLRAGGNAQQVWLEEKGKLPAVGYTHD